MPINRRKKPGGNAGGTGGVLYIKIFLFTFS